MLERIIITKKTRRNKYFTAAAGNIVVVRLHSKEVNVWEWVSNAVSPANTFLNQMYCTQTDQHPSKQVLILMEEKFKFNFRQ